MTDNMTYKSLLAALREIKKAERPAEEIRQAIYAKSGWNAWHKPTLEQLLAAAVKVVMEREEALRAKLNPKSR